MISQWPGLVGRPDLDLVMDSLVLLGHLGITVVSHIIRLGDAATGADSPRPGPGDLARVDESSVRCFDPATEAAMVEAVKAAAKDGDSLGGVAEVLAYGVPVGLGSHVHWDRKLDALLAQALMSIQAVKAVEIGEGWENATRRGSDAHDAITFDDVLLIPAGVAHKNIGSSTDFKCVGAYPEGRDFDINLGKSGERPGTDKNIRKVPIPKLDPLYGKEGCLSLYWYT